MKVTSNVKLYTASKLGPKVYYKLLTEDGANGYKTHRWYRWSACRQMGLLSINAPRTFIAKEIWHVSGKRFCSFNSLAHAKLLNEQALFLKATEMN